MVGLSHIFSHLKPFQALLLGDFLLDTYTTGKVRRISPEAPVPIMEVSAIESRPGGRGQCRFKFARSRWICHVRRKGRIR